MIAGRRAAAAAVLGSGALALLLVVAMATPALPLQLGGGTFLLYGRDLRAGPGITVRPGDAQGAGPDGGDLDVNVVRIPDLDRLRGMVIAKELDLAPLLGAEARWTLELATDPDAEVEADDLVLHTPRTCVRGSLLAPVVNALLDEPGTFFFNPLPLSARELWSESARLEAGTLAAPGLSVRLRPGPPPDVFTGSCVDGGG